MAAAALGSVMSHLPDETWAGRPALVLGYGRLGRQMAARLRDVHRMRVAVHDTSAARAGHRAPGRPPRRPRRGRGSLRGEHAAAFGASARTWRR